MLPDTEGLRKLAELLGINQFESHIVELRVALDRRSSIWNSRLALLGDHAVRLCLSDYFFENEPDMLPSTTSPLIHELVSHDFQVKVAPRLGLPAAVGTRNWNLLNTKERDDVYESAMGLVFRLRGYNTLKEVICKHVIKYAKDMKMLLYPEIGLQPRPKRNMAVVSTRELLAAIEAAARATYGGEFIVLKRVGYPAIGRGKVRKLDQHRVAFWYGEIELGSAVSSSEDQACQKALRRTAGTLGIQIPESMSLASIQ